MSNFVFKKPLDTLFTFLFRDEWQINNGNWYYTFQCIISSECEKGHYGKTCMIKCGQCDNGDNCDKDSGTCPNGCKINFKPPLCIGKKRLSFLFSLCYAIQF